MQWRKFFLSHAPVKLPATQENFYIHTVFVVHHGFILSLKNENWYEKSMEKTLSKITGLLL